MTPQERLKIFNQERQAQQPKTAEERRRLFFQEQAGKYQQPERSAYQALKGGLAQAGGTLAQTGLSLYEAGKEAVGGNFAPAKELVESAGRGALKFASAFDPAGNAYEPTAAEQDPRLAELERRRAARQGQTPAGRFIQQRNAQLAAEAAQDTSTTNKVARGVGRFAGEAAPAVVTGALTGGSVPAIAATTALQSARQPENIVPSALLGAAPLPVGQAFKAGVNAVRRAFGKGAAQIIEAEALPAATAQVRQSIGEAAPVAAPAVGEASPAVRNAMRQFEEAVQRINASNLTPRQKAIELEIAIQRIGQEASGRPPGPGISAVSLGARRGYPDPIQQFPENPNPVQQAGILPGESMQGATVTGPQTSAAMGMEGPPQLSAEVGPPQFGVKAAPELPYTETTGPALGEDALNAAVSAAAQSLPKRVVGNALEPFRLLRSVLASGDISAPFRQGALLTLNPSQWVNGNVPRAAIRMFKSFSNKQYEQIAAAIGADADGQIGQQAGLQFTTQGLEKGEEYFLSKLARKTPVLRQSEQAYKTYLDSLRLDRFKGFKQAIDKAGLSPEQTQAGYKAAADWINIATGRGSFGKTIDKALPVLNEILFAPRNLASRLQILNPATYAKNAGTAEGRVVLKEQMKDLLQFAGTVAGVYQLAKAAGAEVSTNPNSPDFLKIKTGNYRYDPLAGLQQVMRVVYRAGADIERAATGQKSEGESALDIAGRFLRSKLAPVPSYFTDFITRRTFTGKPFEQGKAIIERTVPLQWQDFVEAYQAEGLGGAAKTLPGFAGVGVQRYEQHPIDAAIDKAQPLFSELNRLNRRVSDLRAKDGEPQEKFKQRVQQFGQNYTLYGLRLLDNPRFKAAPDNVKALALDNLNQRAKAITSRELAFPELELDANTIMDSAESSKKNPANK